MNAKKDKSSEPAVRDRLLDAADRLFYREGIRAVGIDRVLAEAGAAKASLYAHFGSKDELIAAFIERRTLDARADIEAFVAEAAPAQQALKFFDFVVAWANDAEFRGCPVQHVVGEIPDRQHPARRVAAAQRVWLEQRLRAWAEAAGVRDPDATASALLVLFDGAVSASEQDGAHRAQAARALAEQVLDAGRTASR